MTVYRNEYLVPLFLVFSKGRYWIKPMCEVNTDKHIIVRVLTDPDVIWRIRQTVEWDTGHYGELFRRLMSEEGRRMCEERLLEVHQIFSGVIP